MISIVEETPEHRASVRSVNDQAFGGPGEGDIVERLHADGFVALSLVATEEGGVVGHLLFSELDLMVDGRSVRAVSLAPMAVRPDRQRRGIGSQMIEQALPILQARGQEAVVVLGHPDYYPRFGFSPELCRKLQAPFSGDALMALELVPGALAGTTGSIRYPAAFGIPDGQ